MDGPLRMVLMRDRSTKESHNAVTEKVVHSSLVPMDLSQHELDCTID
jgi:hypothetical protein